MSRCLAALLACLALVSYSAGVRAGEEESKRAENAVRVLREVMMAPDKRIPSDLISNAYAIAVRSSSVSELPSRVIIERSVPNAECPMNC